MKIKIIEHILSLIFVTAVLVGVMYLFSNKNQSDENSALDNSIYSPDFINFDVPFEKALLKDVLNVYYPDQVDENSRKVDEAAQLQNQQFLDNIKNSTRRQTLDSRNVFRILVMYLKFIFVYLVVMTFTYYAVLTAGCWRFIRKEAEKEEYINGINNSFGLYKWPLAIGRKFIKTLIHMILFSPAFVIAYSMKTELNTDSIPFMILLGVISNGLLIIYTNKFYAFLVSESRKGYVDTAVVKNMDNSYLFNQTSGIQLKALFKPVKDFDGHVFNHIFKNAVIQYSSTLKEQAAFLITGLIIIEMALNIHGYLNYEMLKQILYGNTTIVVFIILLLFYTAKLTEVVADILNSYNMKKYRNN